MLVFRLHLSYIWSLFFLLVISSCQGQNNHHYLNNNTDDSLIIEVIQDSIDDVQKVTSKKYVYSWLTKENKRNIINNILPPKGYQRKQSTEFGGWLRNLPLSSDSIVYLYNGTKKYNQTAQYKIINIDIGKKDLQQCADAVMRLRAEYLFSIKAYSLIHFNYTNGVNISFNKWSGGFYPRLTNNEVNWVVSTKNDTSYYSFKKYLNNIFMYAGTSSLSKELVKVEVQDIQIGDVFIQGGFPGHAVIVVDVAENAKKEKCFMLAQSYMPAQNVHILKNPTYNNHPWYYVNDYTNNDVITPEWTFNINQLKRFKQ